VARIRAEYHQHPNIVGHRRPHETDRPSRDNRFTAGPKKAPQINKESNDTADEQYGEIVFDAEDARQKLEVLDLAFALASYRKKKERRPYE